MISLEQFIASQTRLSRRKITTLIQDQHIHVNGALACQFTQKINPTQDKVSIKGTLIQYKHQHYYYKFYKPKGVISTLDDPKGRRCLDDYLKPLNLPLFPVGRLDRDSSGLMLFTNDGPMTQQLMHPRYEHTKVYKVKLKSAISQALVNILAQGVILDDGPIIPYEIQWTQSRSLTITITEGRNRLLRRLFHPIGFDDIELKRTSISGIELGNLKRGELRSLNREERQQLRQSS